MPRADAPSGVSPSSTTSPDGLTRALVGQVAAQVRCQLTKRCALRSTAGELRIRLDTTYLELPRPTLGSVRRSYEGINALALLVSERHPDAVR